VIPPFRTFALSATSGAIPPLAELQAQLWIISLLNRLPNPLQPEDNYRLHVSSNSRIQYGVDHESYAYQLAVDMGSAPSFTQVLVRGWKITLVWALGANFNTKFRLVGPWAWEGATEVLEGECWETITRRGGFFGE
jgi:dimethylaniline monooxygenase (N-oxide forming)